jgi:hypothetical protein
MALDVLPGHRMKKHVLIFLTAIAACPIASAQLVSYGVTGGVPLVDRTTGHSDESRPYIIGPSIEFRLPAGFAIEVSALYQRIGGTTNFQSSTLLGSAGYGVTYFNDRLRGNSWQFPVLGKYYFRQRARSWQPFLGTGWAFRAVGLHQSINETLIDANGISNSFKFKTDSRADAAVGAVFAAGMRYRVGRLAFSPELRYTRWGSEPNSIRKNEASFLLGIHF